jgi:hypothetical protein
MKALLSILCLIFIFSSNLLASGDHDDDHGKGDPEEKHEEASRFGPTKGVIEAEPKLGFKLHERASANFKIEVMKLGASPWRIPSSALVFAKEERHVYRLKDGFFKSIDVKILKREGASFLVSSSELSSGDQIVSAGTGFLAIVDEAVFGAELSHDH